MPHSSELLPSGVAVVATGFWLLACSSPAPSPDAPAAGGASSSVTGAAGTGVQPGGGAPGAAGGSGGATPLGGQAGTAPGAGGAGAGGTVGVAAGSGGMPGSGGVMAMGGASPLGGAGGRSDTAGTGVGGALAGGPSGGAPSAGGAGSAGTGGAASGGCPADATFCSDFEADGIPTGAAFMPAYQASMWSDFMAIDSTTAHGGTRSLMVKPTGNDGYSYRALAVPVPGPSFWVRLWVKSDQDLGQAEHNAFFGASTADGDQNNGDLMEVAEQYCQVVMNLHDDVVTSVGGTTACGSGGVLLTKNQWHCAEAFFDGPNGRIQVFSDNQPVIDKTGWTKLSYKTFVFGFIEFHGPSRTMWYDDVAVGPSRIGCP